MNNKVYYGEYSLMHWIDLILKKNIILPEYQRYFVWNEAKTRTLIDTFKKKQFVPPVTIGAVKRDDTNLNYILDGQQRLTSIFLAYLGLFPDKNTFLKTLEERHPDENDNPDDDEFDNILEWTFEQLTEKSSNKKGILSNVIEGNYKNINFNINEQFLKTTYLGFSYLVPRKADSSTKEDFDIEQQKFYSSVFRNINIQGVSLLPQESRESLYFLDQTKATYFSPDFSKRISINESKVDFVRYLAILSQFAKENSSSAVASGFARNMEKYYEEFIYSIVGDNDSHLFIEYSELFKDDNHNEELKSLKAAIESLELFGKYESIIDLDIYFLGLIYVVIFEKKTIDLSKKEELVDSLAEEIKRFKEFYLHKKNPGALKYLRERIESSIRIYRRYSI